LKYISSSQNPIIKRLTLLMSKSRKRKKEKCFVVTGNRLLSRAVEMGYKVETLFFREGFDENHVDHNSADFFELSSKLFDRVSSRSGSEEVMAILEMMHQNTEDLFITNQDKILVLESPEKPGNIGAILRTAAAADWNAVIITNLKTDIYHPQIIRNSMGGVFTIPVFTDSSENVISFLDKNGLNIIAASLDPYSKHYKRVKYTRPLALVFGAEDKGLDKKWIKIAHQIVKIPVKYPIDSLNLSVSAGILMYHCGEQ
tara:strand:- start:33693 stop:34463 length:771 start_codon:yes stop_codon:yes gene_type:complete